MAYQNIKIEINDGIAILTLNRPEVRNALDYVTWDEIRAGMRELRFNDDAHVIILTGAGGKAFASGADIKALNARTVSEQMNSEVNDILYEITMHKKPVIAAVDGYALGGGCELALACDIRIATKRSKFGQPEVNLGLIPGAGGTQRLVRLVGPGKAKELIFSGAIITAEEAKEIGLVNRVTEDTREAVMAEAEALAKQIMTKGPVAISMAKICINMGSNTDMDTGLMLERMAQTIALSTQDRKEGTAAFLEKRPAQFQGR